MRTIRFNKNAVKPLIEEGIFEQYKANLIRLWNTDNTIIDEQARIDLLEGISDPGDLINSSFVWKSTLEGHEFWYSKHEILKYR